MKLIEKLKPKIKNNRKIYNGIFLCLLCGQIIERNLSKGLKQKSCNCIKIKHGDRSGSRINNCRLYRIWNGMKGRCYDEKNKRYYCYGRKGITIYDDWKNNYMNFKKWALDNGYQDHLQIDRINCDNDYNPDNCRFITLLENNRNRKFNKIDLLKAIEIRKLYKNGHSQKELGRLYNTCHQNISSIINNKTWVE